MKKWNLIFLISLSLSCLAQNEESSCKNIDLRNSVLGEVRNQGDVSWCYAFASADMLEFNYRPNVKISAADLALTYNQTSVGQIMSRVLKIGIPHETGFTKITLQEAFKTGVCPESVFPSEKWVKVSANKEEEIPLKKAFEEIKNLHSKRDYLNIKNLPFYFKFKNVDKEKFLDVLKTSSLESFYFNLAKSACHQERLPLESRHQPRMIIKNPSIFKTIDEILNLGQLVAIDYDYRVLENKDHDKISIDELHTTNIVARRWNSNSNTCEYLIRDSYGASCSDYDPIYECEQGNVWVDQKRIYKNMTSAVFLDSADIK